MDRECTAALYAHGEELHQALEDATSRASKLEGRDPHAGGAEAARAAYDEYALDVFDVSEEDFVAMAAAGAVDRTKISFHGLAGPGAVSGDSLTRTEALSALSEAQVDLQNAGVASDFTDAFTALRAALQSKS